MIIDVALRMQPNCFDSLMQLLEEAGCFIKRSTHINIKPPEGKRYIRLDTIGQEYDEASLRQTPAPDHVHILKIPQDDITDGQIKRLIDIETKLRAGKGKGYQVWGRVEQYRRESTDDDLPERASHCSLEELNNPMQELTDQQNAMKASLREKQNGMK